MSGFDHHSNSKGLHWGECFPWVQEGQQWQTDRGHCSLPRIGLECVREGEMCEDGEMCEEGEMCEGGGNV